MRNRKFPCCGLIEGVLVQDLVDSGSQQWCSQLVGHTPAHSLECISTITDSPLIIL